MTFRYNKNLKLLITSLFIGYVFSCFISCNKINFPPPSYKNGVYFYVPWSALQNVPDTLTVSQYVFSKDYFSFNFVDNSATQDTFWLPTARILGNTTSTDREIKLVVLDSGTTAIAGKHYRLFDKYVMPKDSFATNKIGVVLLRSPDLDTMMVRLTLQIQPSNDFPALMMSDTLVGSSFFQGVTYSFAFGNAIVKPPYWEANVQQYFGGYSLVKYNFMYNVLGKRLGITNDPNEIANMYTYYVQVRSTWITDGYGSFVGDLDANGNQKPLLIDENGIIITFY